MLPTVRHWLIASVTLVLLIGLVCAWAYESYYPVWWLQDCRERFLPSLQASYGFRAGEVSLPKSGSSQYALVEVDPAGRLGKAGFQTGDIPVADGGGFRDFCAAMRLSVRGEGTLVTVIRAPKYDDASRHTVIIPSTQ